MKKEEEEHEHIKNRQINGYMVFVKEDAAPEWKVNEN